MNKGIYSVVYIAYFVVFVRVPPFYISDRKHISPFCMFCMYLMVSFHFFLLRIKYIRIHAKLFIFWRP